MVPVGTEKIQQINERNAIDGTKALMPTSEFEKTPSKMPIIPHNNNVVGIAICVSIIPFIVIATFFIKFLLLDNRTSLIRLSQS